VGLYLPRVGHVRKGHRGGQKAIALDPDFPFAYVNLIENNLNLGRLDEAENALQRPTGHKFEIDELQIARYEAALLRGDNAGMERALAAVKGRPSAEDWLTDHSASAMAYSGHLEAARKTARKARELARAAAKPDSAALYETGIAVWDALFGNWSEARRSAIAVLQRSNARDVEYDAALALAVAGDLSRSQLLTDELEKRFPEDTIVRFSYLPVLRALVALNRHDSSKAIDLLNAAVRYELGIPGSSLNGTFGALYPIYVRGNAYLAAHQGVEAAGEFQRILDHRWVLHIDALGALTPLQLGRALALAGDQTKAKTAFEDFPGLWKDADPSIPILKQAQAEYARLP
jgi:tetratricopeptide (TPR) repeat protein